MMQKGILLRAANHAISETPVPRPPADRNAIDTAAYASLLKAADPQHLLLAAVPFSERAGMRVLLVYDASGTGEENKMATRLTTRLHEGLRVEIKGDALAFYAQPGADLGEWEWQQIDNAIYDLAMEFFEQGRKPTEADIQGVVDAFREGKFDYNKDREGEEGEDVNKDDAGEDLADALQDA